MRPASHPVVAGTRALLAAAVVITLSLGITACRPEPSASESPSGTGSPSPSATGGAPAETATPQPGADIDLPAGCESIYSSAMLASLNAQNPPLNDPGLTMTSTQNVEALEILSSGVATLRCSWGQPSEFGLATNVSIIDADQSQTLLGALSNAGFACEPLNGGVTCGHEQTVIDQDDNVVTIIETHVIRGNGWVSTTSIDFTPEGYTEDIVATLWS